MKEVDELGLDFSLLRALVAVHDHQSVTMAAATLGITQSSMSHRVERLRAVFGRDLFVRVGRRITSSPGTDTIVERARALLIDAGRLVADTPLDVATIREKFVIAATDLERTLFLAPLQKHVLAMSPGVTLQFLWDQYDNRVALRQGLFDVAFAPLVVRGEPDFLAHHVCHDGFACYYDGSVRGPVTSMTDYLAAEHLRVIISATDTSFVDTALSALGQTRRVRVNVPSLADVALMVRGTPLVVTAPSLLAHGLLSDLDHHAPPFSIPPVDLSMQWHRRTHESLAHRWMRDLMLATARDVLSTMARPAIANAAE